MRDLLWAWRMPFGIYLLAVSLVGLILMGVDKRRSKRPGTRRIRERTLFLVAWLGGSPGTLAGMWLFHHKTRHWYFRYGIPIILAVQICLVGFAAYYFMK